MDSSSTVPSGNARIWTLGLVSASPVMRSSTMPPFFSKAARYTSTARLSASGCMLSTRSLMAAASCRRPEVRQPAQVHHCVARAGDALVQLHDRLAQRRPSHAHALHARHDVVDRVEILGPDRTLHPELLEHPPAAGLAAEVLESRIRTVHRDPKAQRDVALERCGVVRDQVTALRIGDQRPDLPQKPRPRKQFRAQRDRRRVTDRNEGEPLAGVTGNHSRQQPEVVLDDRLGHRL